MGAGIERTRPSLSSQAPSVGAALIVGSGAVMSGGSREKFRGRRSMSYIDWALLMKHSMGINVLECPKCSSAMQPIAVSTEPEVIERTGLS